MNFDFDSVIDYAKQDENITVDPSLTKNEKDAKSASARNDWMDQMKTAATKCGLEQASSLEVFKGI